MQRFKNLKLLYSGDSIGNECVIVSVVFTLGRLHAHAVMIYGQCQMTVRL